MRYTELPWPFEGWTVDDTGVLHSPSGYRTTPAKIEAFCWIMGMHKAVQAFGGHRLMFNESSIEEKRPIFDWKDTQVETQRPNDIKVQPTSFRSGKSPCHPLEAAAARRPRHPRRRF